MPLRHWLIKTEPESYSIQHLAKEPRQTTFWNGVRNYQARNTLRDDMQAGDLCLFYHSSANPPAVVGTATVVAAGYPDFTARDVNSKYYDPKANDGNPIWFMVDVKLGEIFAEPLPLEELRQVPALKDMELLRRGSRLSVQPVRAAEYAAVLKLSKQPRPTAAPAAKTGAKAASPKQAKPAGKAKPAGVERGVKHTVKRTAKKAPAKAPSKANR